VTGSISCFDRILFKGYLPLGWPEAMERLLFYRGLKIKDFKSFVMRQSQQMGEHAEAVAQAAGRPYLYWSGRFRKEDLVRRIAAEDGVGEGLVCVGRILEPCFSFAVMPGEGRPRLVRKRRQCLSFYYYFLDRRFGLMHVRVESWFPLTIQVCLNGHDWLARRMQRAGIRFQQQDNAFLAIEDPLRAQRLADRFVRLAWPRLLEGWARRVNPLLADVLAPLQYYWVVDQAEFATDVLFRDAPTLAAHYKDLLQHALVSFGAEDVLTFLGRKLSGNFQGEVLSDLKDKRWPGARIKHRMKENWIKMYDKHGRVLRVETVINRPTEFKVRRQGTRRGRTLVDWFPMRKGVGQLPRYREVAAAANRRYLDALADAPDRSTARRQMQQLAQPVRDARGRSHRGFNPASAEDVQLFAAVLRGEHALHGFRNADLRASLCPPTADPAQRRCQSHRIGRQLKRLHEHGLIAKIPRSRRWRVTATGQALMKTVLIHHHEHYPHTLTKQAA
jgi:hypothetical protein